MNTMPSVEVLERLYYLLVKIRVFEERIVELYPRQEMRCPVHLCEGQEAVAVGVCSQLKRTDYIFSTHRNHGHLIAKGADPGLMLAEIYGRASGCSAGKGGSMHMVFPADGVLGTSAIVAGGIPLAVGTAFASQFTCSQRVSIAFFGDGAVDEGTFYESLNFAALKRLPVVFFCENNLYATNSPQSARQANCAIHEIGGFFRMPHERIDGNDLLGVYRSAGKAIAGARRGQGPSLIEACTFRIRTHVGHETDIEKGLRDPQEVRRWKEACPLVRFRQALLREHGFSAARLRILDKQAKKEIDAAVVCARKGPLNKPRDLWKDVY